MPKSNKHASQPSQDDIDLFRQSIGAVSKLKQDKVALDTPKPPPLARQKAADESAVMQEIAHGFYDHEEIETDDELLFKRSGIQHKVLQKLKRGQFIIEAELDLHGLSVAAAKLALAKFLIHCQHKNRRCVRIIHGKGLRSPQGMPVLKRKLPGWLQQRDAILAYCPAPANDGGTGAIYVLLKRA